MRKKERLNLVVVASILAFVISLVFVAVQAGALAAGNSTNSNLTIFDETDSVLGSLIKLSGQQIRFYANYTNFTGSAINDTILSGICTIAFDTSGSYGNTENMSYNSTSLLWQTNNTFNRKGLHNFRIACNSTEGNITLNDSFLITNTAPTILSTSGNTYVDFDGNTGTPDRWPCTEDTLCTFNFSANVTDPDLNDILLYNHTLTSNTTLTNFTMNSSTGILRVNVTNDASAGGKEIELNVRDSEGGFEQRILRLNITAVNDIPYFINLSNRQTNITFLYSEVFQAFDEEESTPFNLTLNFTSCIVAEWSTRGSNCTLFADNQYSFNANTGLLNITFTPQRNDVGNYTLNFTLKDAQNGTNSTLVNFSIINVNLPPYFRYQCNSEREATENSEFTCIVNVSDIDETNNLTIRSFVNGTGSWWTFNGSGTSILSKTVNSSTQFNATFFVNFTPTDSRVGNWSVNLTVNDTGFPTQSNSTVFYFFVDNVQDSVFMDDLAAVTAYTSNNYTIYLNASDDDLLIPDKAVYFEVLNFSSNNSNVAVVSHTNISNVSMARITFNPNSLGVGDHYINISVNDASGNRDSSVLNVTVVNNTPPSWNASTQVNFTLNEGTSFFLNLTANVTDVEGNSLTFSFSNDSAFPNFAVNATTGIINFTPADGDVGRHSLLINVSDGITPVPLSFTLTVFNLNETPRILRPLTASYNVTVNITSSNMSATEDSSASFDVYVHDEDFKIPLAQRAIYYNESLTLNLTISGPNPQLFSLSQTLAAGANPSLPNLTIYSATFNPNKSDVGNYNISLNITDTAGLSDFIQFNLSISSIDHVPNVSSIANQTSRINATFILDINASDLEDDISGSNNGNLTYNITFLQGIDFVTGQSVFNITTGMLNITFNDSQSGIFRLNVTVNDSTQQRSSRDFYLFVYGVPSILSPATNVVFNLSENNATNMTFSVNHSVGDNLTLQFSYNSDLRHNISSFSNGSSVNWEFSPLFTDETYGQTRNITLLVFNPTYPMLNTSRNWSINISHTNAPTVFYSSIANQQKTYDQQITVNISQHFYDLDSNDSFYNQSLNFTVRSNMTNASTISVSVTNGSLINQSILTIFTSGSDAFESFNITVNDSVYSNVSNAFTIQFTTPSQSQGSSSQQSSSGGGGGSSQIRPVSLNIIVPGPVTARKQDRLVVPIELVNNGRVDLNGVLLRNLIAKNGILREDLIASFDRSFIETLPSGASENLTLIVDVDTTDPGLYEITLNGTATSPSYSDAAKLYINVEEGDAVAERISFTQEFITQNPQCIEIKELVDQARELYLQGALVEAQDKTEEALQACQNSISQAARVQQRERIFERIVDNIGLASVAALLIGVSYYWFRRLRLQRAVEANFEQNIDGTEGKV